MTDAKHTPGPWIADYRKNPDDKYRTQVFPENDPDNTIATCHWHSVKTATGWTTDRDANAHLIAAAPDLLEALKDAKAVINGARNEYGEHPAWEDAIRTICAALAKAKGEAT